MARWAVTGYRATAHCRRRGRKTVSGKQKTVGQKRESIRNEMKMNLQLGNLPSCKKQQVAQATGANDQTVSAQRKKKRAFRNMSARDAKMLKAQHPDWPVIKIAKMLYMQRDQLSELFGGQVDDFGHLTTVEGEDGKRYPASNEDAGHPEWPVVTRAISHINICIVSYYKK